MIITIIIIAKYGFMNFNFIGGRLLRRVVYNGKRVFTFFLSAIIFFFAKNFSSSRTRREEAKSCYYCVLISHSESEKYVLVIATKKIIM